MANVTLPTTLEEMSNPEHAEVAGIRIGPVTSWFEQVVPGIEPPLDFEVIAGGHSNLTFLVTDRAGRRFVLRRPPLGQRLASAHDMGREHRIINALSQSDVPVPPAIGFCEDPEINDDEFYVMGYVDGHVLRDPAAVERTLSLEARSAASRSLVDTMAAIHGVDIDQVGLADLGRHDGYIARQLKRWYSQWNQQRTRDLPAIDQAHDLLAAMIPDQGPARLVHGDYRLDNCMVDDDGNVTAVLDWEICTLGDPLADLGLLLVYWTGPDDAASAWEGGATSVEGFWNREQLVQRYGEVSGRDLSRLDF
jgi:aminoglycoside phosphotransferase (APT) family kinase protein